MTTQFQWKEQEEDMRKRLSVVILAVSAMLAGCTGGGGEAVDTAAAPVGVVWGQQAGVRLPVASADDGPGVLEPVPHQFAHTPQGAVMAAMITQVWMATASDDQWTDVSNLMLAPSPGRDQWAQGRVLMSVDGVAKNPPVYRGFQMVDYTDEQALIGLLAEYPDVGLAVYPTQLAWMNDTWKVVLPTLDEAPDITPVDSTDGFTLFGPESKEQ